MDIEITVNDAIIDGVNYEAEFWKEEEEKVQAEETWWETWWEENWERATLKLLKLPHGTAWK